jgi:uncharacterized protein (TIGR02246 family)
MNPPTGTAVGPYFDAFQDGDASAVADLFTSSGVIAPLGMGTIHGRPAIKETFDGFFGTFRTACEQLVVDRIVRTGDAAFVETHSVEHVTNGATGQRETAHYRELFCLVSDDGDWRIASYMFNH